MPKRKRRLRFIQAALLVAVAAGLWWYENVPTAAPGDSESEPDGGSGNAPATETRLGSKPESEPVRDGPGNEIVAVSRPEPASAANANASVQREAVATQEVNGYDRLLGTVLVEHRNNDGDSFHVRHGDREFELRLYYADSPEKYLSDRYEDQRRRVAEQARELGGLSIDDTVALGKEARAHVLSLLEGQSFSVFTKWESVYDSERYYGFLLLPGGTDWLCENLVGNGLARIHTKGEATPDGQSYREFKRHLESLEAKAKSARRGAWR